MTQESLNKTLKILGIISLIVIILYAVLQVGAYFMNLVTIFGISIVLTYVLLGPVDALEKLLDTLINRLSSLVKTKTNSKPGELTTKPLKLVEKLLPSIHKRVLSIFIVYITFILVVIFIAFQLIPPAIYQVSEFARNIPTYTEEGINYINKKFPEIEIPGLSKAINKNDIAQIEQEVPVVIHEIPEDADIISSVNQEKTLVTTPLPSMKKISKEHLKNILTATASKFQNDITSFITNNAQNAISNLINLLAGTLTGIGYTLTVIVLSFYFLLDGKTLVNGINALIPRNLIDRATDLEKSIHNSLLGFLKGQVYLGFATGGFMLIIYILFDVKYSIFLSLFLALAEIIPVIGSSLGFIPAVIVMLFTDPVSLLFVWLIFFIFQTIKDNIVAPKIVGEIIGLHPVTVIFALWIGFQVAGFFGILFAIPVASVINVIINYIIKERMNTEVKSSTG